MSNIVNGVYDERLLSVPNPQPANSMCPFERMALCAAREAKIFLECRLYSDAVGTEEGEELGVYYWLIASINMSAKDTANTFGDADEYKVRWSKHVKAWRRRQKEGFDRRTRNPRNDHRPEREA